MAHHGSGGAMFLSNPNTTHPSSHNNTENHHQPTLDPQTHFRLQQQLQFFRERFPPAAFNEARTVQDAARRLQAVCGDAGRVHVIYESGDTEREGSVNILFSQTLSFVGPASLQGGAMLAQALRTIADLSTPPTPPGRCPFSGGMQGLAPYEKETLSWYPGDKLGRNDRAVWVSEKIDVKEDTYSRFKRLDRKGLDWVYQKLFAKMFRIMKPRIPNEKGPMRYLRFTPPWMRKNIAIGKNVIILDADSMPELRGQRNRMGERRLKAVMAALFEKEPLARGILRELLNTVPEMQNGAQQSTPATQSTQLPTPFATNLHTAPLAQTRPAPSQAATALPAPAPAPPPAPLVPSAPTVASGPSELPAPSEPAASPAPSAPLPTAASPASRTEQAPLGNSTSESPSSSEQIGRQFARPSNKIVSKPSKGRMKT